MKTRVLVVEDEFIIAEDILETLKELGYQIAGYASTYSEALIMLNSVNPDIALVDINLNEEKDGVDLGTVIREKHQLPFIFITSHADKTTVEKAKHLKPNGYLLKPIDKNDLYTGIEIALANFSKQTLASDDTENTTFIKDGTSFIKLKYADILFIKSDANYVSIQTTQKKHLIRKTLKEFGATLPAEIFLQIHKSYIINTVCIKSLHADHVMIDQHEIPIGREFKELFLKRVKLT
jgi:two-component system, LytTR family, response regulator LytT